MEPEDMEMWVKLQKLGRDLSTPDLLSNPSNGDKKKS